MRYSGQEQVAAACRCSPRVPPGGDTPQRAIEQLALLVLQTGSKLSRDDVRHYVRESIDVFVQLDRRGGRRQVSRVLVAE